jgi:hypothetical protein
MWLNQTQIKNDWPVITNPQGKQFSLPPKRHIIHLLKEQNSPPLSDDQQNQILNIATDIHQLRYAPEPLATMTSHFQLLHQSQKENSLWISLTNTSSRKTRPDLIQKVMRVLYQYKPTKTFIQEMTQTSPHTTYQTPNVQSVITVLLSAQQEIQHMTMDFQIVPRNLPMTTILTHIRNPITTTSQPLSSTNPTSTTQTGNPQNSPPKHQISPTSTPSTMETTSTLSSQQNIIPIPTERSVEYLNSLKEILLVLQRRIQ